MTKNKFRASFSVLNTWASGDYNTAVLGYFHQPIPKSAAMEFGGDQHDLWCTETQTTHRLPELFGGKPFINPHCEQKIVIQLDNWLELVGKPDCYHFVDKNITIVEYKTGTCDSAAYANSMQLPVYQLLLPQATRGEIYHWNQYTGEIDMSIVHLTPTTLQTAVEWVLTYSSEMYNYLITNELYERFNYAPSATSEIG